jgi:hypothetical protein
MLAVSGFAAFVHAQTPLNIDGSNTATRHQASTDGLLVLRYLSGYRGNALTQGAVSPSATRNTSQIETHLSGLMPQLDVDNDGTTSATSDGVMIVRRLLGLSGTALTAGAKRVGGSVSVSANATDRAIASAIDKLMEGPPGSARGLWVWTTNAVLADAAEADRLLLMAEEAKLTDVYLYVVKNNYQARAAELRALNARFALAGIRVWGLDGDRGYFSDARGPQQIFDTADEMIRFSF